MEPRTSPLFEPGVCYKQLDPGDPPSDVWQDVVVLLAPEALDCVEPSRSQPVSTPRSRAAASCKRCGGAGETEVHGALLDPDGGFTSIRFPIPCSCQKGVR